MTYFKTIPTKLFWNQNITDSAKLFYSIITSLCRQEGYCWATNKYLSKFYENNKAKAPVRTIQRWLKELIDEKFISVEIEENHRRKITILPIEVLEENGAGVQKNVTGASQERHEGALESSGGCENNTGRVRQEQHTEINKYNNININNININKNNTPIIPKGDVHALCSEEKNINTTFNKFSQEQVITSSKEEGITKSTSLVGVLPPSPPNSAAPPLPPDFALSEVAPPILEPETDLSKSEILQAKLPIQQNQEAQPEKHFDFAFAPKPAKKRSRDELPPQLEAQFEELWAFYGRKGGKAPARQSFAKALKKVDFENLKSAIEVYLCSETVIRGFKKDFATYLNQECWESDFPPPKDPNGDKPPELAKYEDREKKLKIYNVLETVKPEIERRRQEPSEESNIKFFGELAGYCHENGIDVNKIDEWLQATRKELTNEQ